MQSNANVTYAAETLNKIRAQYAQLKALDKAALKRRVQQSRKVSDLRGVGKDELVSMILRDEHGNRLVDAAFA